MAPVKTQSLQLHSFPGASEYPAREDTAARVAARQQISRSYWSCSYWWGWIQQCNCPATSVGTETLAQPQTSPGTYLYFPSSGTRRRSQPASWPAQSYRPLWFKPCNCESHWVIIQEAILFSQWDFPYWGQQWDLQHRHPPLKKTCMSQHTYPLKH